MSLEIRQLVISDDLLRALEKRARQLTYTNPKTIYSCVDADYRDVFVGVFGDGSNGAYEWFIWDAGSTSQSGTAELRTSDCGYGCTGVALCCGLVESKAEHSRGDHDVVLSWVRKEADHGRSGPPWPAAWEKCPMSGKKQGEPVEEATKEKPYACNNAQCQLIGNHTAACVKAHATKEGGE